LFHATNVGARREDSTPLRDINVEGTFGSAGHWKAMPRYAVIGLVIGILFGCATQARAETCAERADTDNFLAPTAAEVISQLYQFDLFQQNAMDRADSSSRSDIVTTAATRAEAALKRDKAVAELQQRTGTELPSERKAAMRAHGVNTLDQADGPSYVREYYAAQLAEYQLTVDLLERYLQHPDNEDVRSFAAAQLPALRSELMDTRNALADK
jgi:uncharacterized protein DUF4142